jgi:hypothetical protein
VLNIKNKNTAFWTFKKPALYIFILIAFTFVSQEAYGQFEPGRLTTISFGAGNSSHAGSYTIQESFREKQFSGFRALIFEIKLGWSFAEVTSIYGVTRLSPSNSIVSPYRSTYFGLGLSQALPFYRQLYVTGNYGKYASSLGAGIKAGSGNLINLGAGMRLDDNLYAELNRTFGNLKGMDSSLDISSKESQWFGTISFRF